MKDIEDLIITFEASPNVFLGVLSNEMIISAQDHMIFDCCPWPSQPDLLVSENTFCGITYNIGREYLELVKLFVSSIQSSNIRIVDVSEYPNVYNYNENFSTKYYLEIIWTISQPEKMIFGALVEDSWIFYNNASSFPENSFGLHISSFSDIMNDFSLSLPENFISSDNSILSKLQSNLGIVF